MEPGKSQYNLQEIIGSSTNLETQPWNDGDIMKKLTGWWLTYPSEKYEFVSWDDDIPN